MAVKPNIDWALASSMLNVVIQQAAAGPRFNNLGQQAMHELKVMDEKAKEYHDEIAREMKNPRAIPSEPQEDDIVATAPPIADPVSDVPVPVARRV